jgi:hypothetical protein
MTELKLQYYFDAVMSYDNGTTLQNVRVGYDYYPEEINYPYDRNSAEIFDIFVFDLQGNNITYDIPKSEGVYLMEEAKRDFAQIQKDRNEI